MSQRECAGFNWPRLAVEAGEPVDICPRTCLSSECVFWLIPEPCPSAACGDAQPLKNTWSSSRLRRSSARSGLPVECPASVERGVAQPLNNTESVKFDRRPPMWCICPVQCSPSRCAGVGHPPQPLPDMRRADARSAEIGGPDGIAHSFQVSAYTGEPRPSKLRRNLLASDACRAALRDEAEELGPEVAGVGSSLLLAGGAERLARTASSP